MGRRGKGAAFLLALGLTLAALSARAADLPPSGAVDGAGGRALLGDIGDRLLVLDVRTPEEFAAGHVPGAWLIPVSELEERQGEIPGGRPVLIVCRSGGRATTAYELLAKARPEMLRSGLWRLAARPEYRPDGSFIFP